MGRVSIPFSILDLCAVPEGSTAADALENSARLAQAAERLDYKRFWLAEHHNMPGIASAATSVVIGHVAARTRKIRLGAGGVMLPNHSPLVIAEQFGTLASLYPGRIDLGLGRAPGSDQATARAMRRDVAAAERFPQDVVELLNYFGPERPEATVRAVPGTGLDVPLWLLGSSTFSAQLAAHLGLPFAFAAHFAPADLEQAVHLYRNGFQPSEHLAQPYVMVVVNIICADTDDAAKRIFTSQQQAFVNLRRGRPGKVPPPIASIDAYCSPIEREMINAALALSFIGSPDTVRKNVEAFSARIRPDELMVAGHFYDFSDRLHSLELVARELAVVPA